MPFVDLNLAAVYFTGAARRLEGCLHHHFSEFQIGTSEWFDLPEDQQNLFTLSTRYLLDLFEIPDTEWIEEEDEQPIKKIEKTEFQQIEIKAEEPKRLKRLPKYQNLNSDTMPTIQDELDYGLIPEIKEFYEDLGTWKKVADHYGVEERIVYNIAINNAMPFPNSLRRKLGLCMIFPNIDEPISIEVK